MSRAYDDHIEEMNARRERAHIAAQLGIEPDVLDDHPYTLDYATTNDGGIITAWLIYWDEDVPEGVRAEGLAGHLWTSIQPGYDDEEPEPED